MKVEFYKKDIIEEHTKKELKDVLFFKFEKAPVRGSGDVPYLFDGIATEDHKKSYPDQYQTFLDSQGHKEEVKVEAKESKEGKPKKAKKVA